MVICNVVIICQVRIPGAGKGMSKHGSVGGKDGSGLGGDGDSGQVDDEEQQRQVRCGHRHGSLCWVR